MTAILTALTNALAGRYRPERELGAGGMATVYLAHDLKHDRQVALKVLRPELAHWLGPDRFLAEIKTTARLHHPHILPLYDSGDAEGYLFYVMPLVDGESLRARLERERPLPLADAFRITREVADALAYAHARDVVHRDVKPENILLEGGHALVADFGIARALRAAGTPHLTQTGLAIGTPAYMSPEQAAGDPEIDGRSDLYSLACVLFEMLAGEPPFAGATAEVLLGQRFTQLPPHVSTKRTDVPTPVDAAIHRALARNPDDRQATVERFAETLRDGPTPSAGGVEQSIAVLAFENMSADPENDYFSDGIAEDIINALTQLDGLRVAARTSAFSFKGKREDLRVIGEKLAVATVLEGSVRKAGSRLRITAELINVADGYHLWSERYDRELTDVFAVQDEIATAIAAKLQVTFAKPSEDRAARPTTVHVEAYELSLKGRALMLHRGSAILRAVACFERAIALDPDFAPAHAGLAEALRLQVHYGFVRSTEVMPKAKAAVGRALALEPNLADATATLGIIALTYDLDGPTGFEALERALTLNPLLGWARCVYALHGLSGIRGADDEAITGMNRVVAQDPLSAFGAAYRAMVLGVAGRHREAIAEAERATALDPESFHALLVLSWTRLWGSDADGALRAARPALQMSGRNPYVLGMLSAMYAAAGDRARAEAAHRELLGRADAEYVQLGWLAMSALGIGAADEAMRYAMRSVEERETLGFVLIRWPGTELLHSHAAYPELRRRMGI